MTDTLEHWLAQQARALRLTAANADTAAEADLRAFAQAVLDELAARGLVDAAPELGCYARRRPSGH